MHERFESHLLLYCRQPLPQETGIFPVSILERQYWSTTEMRPLWLRETKSAVKHGGDAQVQVVDVSKQLEVGRATLGRLDTGKGRVNASII